MREKFITCDGVVCALALNAGSLRADDRGFLAEIWFVTHEYYGVPNTLLETRENLHYVPLRFLLDAYN